MVQSLLIQNVQILDLQTGRSRYADIYIEEGVVKKIDREIFPKAQYVIDAKGFFAVPGLVDTHSHLFYDTELIGVDPRKYDLPNGVTYCIDQGSAGADNYEEFRNRVLASADVKVRSFLNCSRIGMPVSSLADTGDIPGPGELSVRSDFNREAFIEVYQKYRKELLGIKIRMTPNICPENPLEALEKAIDIAEELNIRVSVHSNHALGVQTKDVLSRLRKGDIFTHTYHKGETGILNEAGQLKACVLDARERGVIFDTGHGVNSLSFEVLEQAAKLGFFPDTISTDLHNLNVNGPVFDMPTTISKFLCVGMPLLDAMRCCILNPVRLLGLEDKEISIREGSVADLAIFELKEGDFTYRDAMKKNLSGKYRLEARFTVTGERLFCHKWK